MLRGHMLTQLVNMTANVADQTEAAGLHWAMTSAKGGLAYLVARLFYGRVFVPTAS